jgi:EmrB/QacA subfamily drug resistance transporter
MIARLSGLPYKWLVAIVFMFGLFMDILDSTAVNVAIPRLQLDFNAPLSTVEWTVTGYLLSLALFIPGAGFLSDRFGTKRIFLTAMAIFVAGSALCGQAHSIQELIAFRFLQGIGGGMMTPVSTAILSREFPGEERAKASAVISIPVILAPILGPVLGGYLVTYASWRWIFYINLPVGIIGFVLAMKVLKEHREPYAQGSFDILGLLTGGAGTALVLYALSEAASKPWTSPDVVATGFGGLAALALFVFVELHASPPMLDLRLFSQGLFTLGTSITIWSFASYAGFLFMLTLFLQELQGKTPLQAGLIQAPSAIGTAIALLLAGRYYSRIGPRRMLVGGFFFGALMLLPFSFVEKSTLALPIIIFLALRGLSTPFAMTAAQTIVYGPLDNAKQGPASSIFNTLRQVAASFGVALLATIQANRYSSHLSSALASAHLSASAATDAMKEHATVMSYHDAFFLSGALLLIGAILALLVNDTKARAAMMKRVHKGADGRMVEEPAEFVLE